MKPKNPYVQSLRNPKGPYGKRVVQSKKIYTRKIKYKNKALRDSHRGFSLIQVG